MYSTWNIVCSNTWEYMITPQKILAINTSLTENLKRDKLLALINYAWLNMYICYIILCTFRQI